MQLSSVLLAAALLVQVASGFYLSGGDDKSNFASYQDQRIGFYKPAADLPASFKVNDAEELVSGDNMNIAFFDRDDGLWRLERTPGDDGGRRAIRGPFAMNNDLTRLVYAGEGLVWYACGNPNALDILLGPPGFDYEPSREKCYENVGMYVHL